MTVLRMADYKLRERQQAKMRQADWCGPCWDMHSEVHHLLTHKIWGGNIGLHCPNCGSEFNAD